MKLVSPMTSDPFVVSTTTKLSDEIDLRLTASAGYDSLVHCQTPLTAIVGICAMQEATSFEDPEHFLHVMAAALFRGGKRQLERGALHMIDEDVQVVGLMSACSGAASKKYDGLRTTN